ncbi:hypothetical protein HF264_19415 [Rhizobium leguminosarum]|uniref:GTPase domain-containing protein n=1 Tax=Rhizobium leguminosarum TaxID=384 RepID=UPI001C91E709|nr:GTPase domain-containing protein [Rhizobium leguminosarum]MBY2941841.1 hypothetical protein [Rhizobium leguminosarum]
MANDGFTAGKSRAKEGAVWVLNFRHPLKPDPRGKPGRKVRRSSGTADEAAAQRLVDQMNNLLSDDRWLDVARRNDAARVFDEIVVRAFYDDLASPVSRSSAVRDARMALPDRSQGYARVLLVGATGAGKTSLLRQLIGSDPKRERFPSTSASRTTISDIEVITTDDPNYSCVATFFDEGMVQTLVHECVADACAVLWEGASDAKIAERLLQHRDMRFRLSYILGAWKPVDGLADMDDEDGFEDGDEEPQLEGEAVPTSIEAEEMQGVLRGAVARIKALAEQARLDVPASTSDTQGREASQDRFEESVQLLPDFDELVVDLMDEIRKRFDPIAEGLTRRPSGWPECWTHLSSDRHEFLAAIRRLSSNYAASFGTLLTPLVDGIRVKGPLHSQALSGSGKFVFLDGEGIGHTKDSAAGVSSHVTSRFDDVDVILLVDNAKAPMLEGPTSLLRAIAASGHHQKLAVAFTHFDALKRQANLLTAADREAHVLASVHQTLASLREVVGPPTVRALERDVEQRCFMLSYLDRTISAENAAPFRALRELLVRLAEMGARKDVQVTAEPFYNLARLHLSIQAAVNEFHTRWDAILGQGSAPGVRKAHWGEVKALNRRVVLKQENREYRAGNLLPVADLKGRLAERITRFLDTPGGWDGQVPTEEEAVATLSQIQQVVFKGLEALAARRLLDDSQDKWLTSFHLRGRGSTFDRARAVQGIFLEGAPPLIVDVENGWEAFVDDIEKLVIDAIRGAGGKMAGEAAPSA